MFSLCLRQNNIWKTTSCKDVTYRCHAQEEKQQSLLLDLEKTLETRKLEMLHQQSASDCQERRQAPDEDRKAAVDYFNMNAHTVFGLNTENKTKLFM